MTALMVDDQLSDNPRIKLLVHFLKKEKGENFSEHFDPLGPVKGDFLALALGMVMQLLRVGQEFYGDMSTPRGPIKKRFYHACNFSPLFIECCLVEEKEDGFHIWDAAYHFEWYLKRRIEKSMEVDPNATV